MALTVLCVPYSLHSSPIRPRDSNMNNLLFSSRTPVEVPVAHSGIVYRPLSTKLGTYKTVKARLWPCLSGKSPDNLLSCSFVVRKRCHNTRRLYGAVELSSTLWAQLIVSLGALPRRVANTTKLTSALRAGHRDERTADEILTDHA